MKNVKTSIHLAVACFFSMSVFVDGQIRLRNGHGRGRLFAGTISSFQGRFLEELEIEAEYSIPLSIPMHHHKGTKSTKASKAAKGGEGKDSKKKGHVSPAPITTLYMGGFHGSSHENGTISSTTSASIGTVNELVMKRSHNNAEDVGIKVSKKTNKRGDHQRTR